MVIHEETATICTLRILETELDIIWHFASTLINFVTETPSCSTLVSLEGVWEHLIKMLPAYPTEIKNQKECPSQVTKFERNHYSLHASLFTPALSRTFTAKHTILSTQEETNDLARNWYDGLQEQPPLRAR